MDGWRERFKRSFRIIHGDCQSQEQNFNGLRIVFFFFFFAIQTKEKGVRTIENGWAQVCHRMGRIGESSLKHYGIYGGFFIIIYCLWHDFLAF